jgi:hypothetical protein
MTCPRCYSERIHRSKRRGIFERRVLSMVFVWPFRCENCDLRFFRGSLTAHPSGFRPAGTPEFESTPLREFQKR